MGGEDVLAVAKAADESERGGEDKGPDQQHAGHGQPGVVLRRADEEDRKGVPRNALPTSPIPQGGYALKMRAGGQL